MGFEVSKAIALSPPAACGSRCITLSYLSSTMSAWVLLCFLPRWTNPLHGKQDPIKCFLDKSYHGHSVSSSNGTLSPGPLTEPETHCGLRESTCLDSSSPHSPLSPSARDLNTVLTLFSRRFPDFPIAQVLHLLSS